MRQFVWALPYIPPEIDLTPLDPAEVRARKQSLLTRGSVPDDCIGIVVGIDTGKRRLHWTAMAVMPEGRRVIIEYGEQPTDADTLGVFRGLLEAFRKLRDYIETAWKVPPAQVWVDSGWHEHTDAVYALCEEANGDVPYTQARWRAEKGQGEGQRMTRYVTPAGRKKNPDVVYVGKEYDIRYPRRNGKRIPGVFIVLVNADHWKSELHQGLTIPTDQPGAVTLYDDPSPDAHADFVTMLVAERQVEKFIKGRGSVITWERISRNNHGLDSSYAAMAAADFVAAQAATAKPVDPSNRPTARELAARGRAG
jgi:phage terminase large subunit GpA-like protein